MGAVAELDRDLGKLTPRPVLFPPDISSIPVLSTPVTGDCPRVCSARTTKELGVQITPRDLHPC